MPYAFIEDMATADIAFHAWGQNLEETFISAVDATINVMVEELESIQPRERREFELMNETLDLLLFDLLQELIYFKDAEQLLLRLHQLQIVADRSPYILKAIALGEKLDSDRHRQRVDVKAVTLHRFLLEKTAGGWEATVILDI